MKHHVKNSSLRTEDIKPGMLLYAGLHCIGFDGVPFLRSSGPYIVLGEDQEYLKVLTPFGKISHLVASAYEWTRFES